MALPSVATLIAHKMMTTPHDRPDAVVGLDVEETDFPWMPDPRPGHAQTAEPAVWIEDILDDLDGRV